MKSYMSHKAHALWHNGYYYLIEDISQGLRPLVIHGQAYKSIIRAHLYNQNHSKLRAFMLALGEISSESKFGPPLDLSFVKRYHFTSFDLCILFTFNN